MFTTIKNFVVIVFICHRRLNQDPCHTKCRVRVSFFLALKKQLCAQNHAMLVRVDARFFLCFSGPTKQKEDLHGFLTGAKYSR